MPNKNYISGKNFEYKVRDYFVNKGYFVVRSAGSKGIADLVAFNSRNAAEYPLLIQCKHHAINKKEIIKNAKTIQHLYIDFIVASMVKRKLTFYKYENYDDNPELFEVRL